MVIEYRALPPQFRFLRSRAQYAGLFGGIGSGKSHVGCFWALVKALRNPRCLGLIGANSYRQLKDATLRTFELTLRRYGIAYEFKATDMAFRLANGAEILCRSLDSYDFLRGVELGWFYLDELREARFEAWQVVKGRLRSPNADAREGRVTSSPNGLDWIYEEFVRKPRDPVTAAAYSNHEAFFARTADNQHLPPDYVDALLASYDSLLAAQELDGQFLNVRQGRIYPAFDRAVHLDPTIELDPRLPICLALDFNVTPMTAVIAQVDSSFGVPPSGGLYSRPAPGLSRSTQRPPEGGTPNRRPPEGGTPNRRPPEGGTPNLEPPEGGTPNLEPPEGGTPSEETRRGGLRVLDELWLLHSGTAALCEAFAEWLAARGEEGYRFSVVGSRGPDNRKPITGNPSSVPLLVFGDAAGQARSTVGKSDYAILQDYFPEAERCVGGANPSRRDRYNAVNAAFRDARGRVRLRIHPRCRHLIEDLEHTVYQPDSNEPDTRDPLRGHISDALGYLVARVMPAGRKGLRVGKW